MAVTWYDGERRPRAEVQALVGLRTLPETADFVGGKGVMLLPHVAAPALFPEAQFRDFAMPETGSEDHYHQFVDAVLSGGKASAGFHYSGPPFCCFSSRPGATPSTASPKP